MDPIERLGASFVDELHRLAQALEHAGVAYAVVGATALLLHGVDLRRTTRDLDLAVAVTGDTDAVDRVLKLAGLVNTSIPHRFRTAEGEEVDVLMIDPAAAHPSEIRLADGDRFDGAALPEAVAQASVLMVAGSGIRVAPLSLLIANKLYAAGGVSGRPHDLSDACAAMESYEVSGTRRFEVDYGKHPELAFETAGAFLAGQDAAQLLVADIETAMAAAIESLMRDARLTDRFAEGPPTRKLVAAYRTGLGIV